MTGKVGFDNEKYLEEQTAEILERVGKFNNKLYLEFGGKLLFDYHAARVLPGYDPNVKMRLLQQLKDKVGSPALHLRRGHRAEEDPRRLRHHLRRRRPEAHRRPAQLGHQRPRGRHHPLRQPARGNAVQEQARAARHPGLHAPLHEGLPHRRRPDRERRGVRRQRLHRDRKSRSSS